MQQFLSPCWLAPLLLLSGCAQGPDTRADAPMGGSALPARPVEAISRETTPPTFQDSGDLGLKILRPSSPATDEVVARVGEQVIRKSHIFDRMRENMPKNTEVLINQLVLDLVLAAQAERFGILVEPEEIDTFVDRDLEALSREVERSFGGRRSLEDYIQKVEGLTLEVYRRLLRLKLARQRYLSYVIRYLAMLEDQVEVRFIAMQDRSQLEDIAKRVQAGADFATLASRHSEDEDTREGGGRLAPFGRSHTHPIVSVAFELEPGQLSAIFEHEDNGVQRYFLVYCLRKMPKRESSFAEVKEEIEKELDRRPIERLEHAAFFLRYCQPGDSLPSGLEGR